MTTTTHTPVGWSDRLGALSGAAYVLLVLVGNGLSSAGENTDHPTGAQVINQTNKMADRLSAQIGMGLEILGFVAFAFFVAWLHGHLRRSGADWLAGVAAVGGVTTLAVKLGSAAPMMALVAERKTIDPQLAQILNLMNGAAFVITFVSFGVLLLGAGLAGLASGGLGRVASWTAVVFGFAGCAIPIASKLDPYETNPIPFLLGLVWVLVVSIRLGVTRSTSERTPELVDA
jgi:hypothetical protein